MNRITSRTSNGMAYLAKVDPKDQEIEGSYSTLKAIQESFNKLAEYEDAEENGLTCRENSVVVVNSKDGITINGKSIFDILKMQCEQALKKAGDKHE